jgi:hypothetical protein
MDGAQGTSSLMVPLLSAVLLTMSAVWLFYGWRIYSLFITVLTAASASIVGWYFVSPHFAEDVRYLPPLLMGLAGGVMAIPLQRVAAFVTQGLLGAAIALAIAVGFCNVVLDFSSPQIIAVAAAGFLIAGVPAAIFYKFLKIISTAGYGAVLGVAGVAAIVFAFADEPPTVGAGLAVLGLAVWAGLTLLGVVVQWRQQIIHKTQTSG